MKQESSESPHSDNAAPDPPPRSRNARAQARHREKRKQYIQSLEQTVARLQAAVTGTPDQLARTHELEQENMRLRSENEMLKAQIGWSPLDPATRRTPVGLFAGHPTDGLVSEAQRDLKRRRTSADGAGDPSHPYLGPAPHHNHNDSANFRSLQTLPPPTSSANASSSSTYGSLSSHANGGSAAPQPPGSTTTPLYAFHSSRSSASSPYSASSLSPLPDLVTAPRRAFDAFGPGDRMDPLAMGGPLHTQQQQQQQQSLGPQAFDRRSSENSGFMDNPFGAQVDLDTWRSYTSYARGT